MPPAAPVTTHRFPLISMGRHYWLAIIRGVKLSVLDQSPIAEGATAADALANTLDLARLADGLGYHRYWVAEHHGGLMLAGHAPEALIPSIAAATTSIRVGSGGVMLPHYSPFKVAEVFTLLAAMYPDRIDLGLGRASGTDPRTAYALQRDRAKVLEDDFPQQLAELLGYLDGTLPEDHPFASLTGSLPEQRPEVWLLGSSQQSRIWATEGGLRYAFADFINPEGAEFARPANAVAVWVVCAETEEEAQRLASSSRMTFSLLRRGRLIAVPPPERALRYLEEYGSSSGRGRRGVIGDPGQVRAGVEEIANAYGAEEVIAVTITYDHEARRHSYELLAEAFGLQASVVAPPGPDDVNVRA
jgi:luciferase family oxidoreductase group 1